MSHVETRLVTGDDRAEALLSLTRYAFEPTPPVPDEADWLDLIESFSESLVSAVYEDGIPVACAGSAPMTQNVRGQILPMSGVWGVATHPLHRHKGYARRAVQKVLEAEHEAGKPVAMLYAFRESWYERLGYVLWPQPRIAIIQAARLSPLVKLNVEGDLELLKLSDGYADYRRYLEARQTVVHGMGLGDPKAHVYSASRDREWLVFARIQGEIAGALTYRIQDIDGDLNVTRFTYSTAEGRYLLLKFLAFHSDQVRTVHITLPPIEQPETWYSDLQVELKAGEPPLGRVLNVSALNDQAVGPGAFTARISDPVCPWNDHIYKFSSVDGQLDVTPSDGAECTLSIQGLSALVYGVRDPAEFAIRGWGNPPPETQQAMRSMFPRTLPWLHVEF